MIKFVTLNFSTFEKTCEKCRLGHFLKIGQLLFKLMSPQNCIRNILLKIYAFFWTILQKTPNFANLWACKYASNVAIQSTFGLVHLYFNGYMAVLFLYYQIYSPTSSQIINCHIQRTVRIFKFCVWNKKDSRFKKDFGNSQNLS